MPMAFGSGDGGWDRGEVRWKGGSWRGVDDAGQASVRFLSEKKRCATSLSLLAGGKARCGFAAASWGQAIGCYEIDLPRSDLTAMQPQPRTFIVSSSPDCLLSITTHEKEHGWRFVSLCTGRVHHGDTACCMASTAVSHKLGSPRDLGDLAGEIFRG